MKPGTDSRENGFTTIQNLLRGSANTGIDNSACAYQTDYIV